MNFKKPPGSKHAMRGSKTLVEKLVKHKIRFYLDSFKAAIHKYHVFFYFSSGKSLLESWVTTFLPD